MTLVEFANLFEEFRASNWDGWRSIFERITGAVREFYAVVGRGGGKSRAVAFIAVWRAAQAYTLVPGEKIYVGIFAPDRKQAGITFRYVLGLLKSVDELACLIVNEKADSVELSNGVVIEVLTASVAAPRGRAYALVIIEEAAFLPQDESVNPDVELLRAVRPALARVPGSLLCVVSSPYARKGVLWNAWQRYHDQPDSDVVFVQAGTLALNPTFDRLAIERAVLEDPASARAEYFAEFRSDVESFVSREAVDAVVVPGRFELSYVGGVSYNAFLDFAGGGRLGSDSATLGIAHVEIRDGRAVAVLDVLREAQPPFSPEQVCAEFATTIRSFRLRSAKSDRWAGQFPIEQMRKHGVYVDPSEKVKSDIYRDALPFINSGCCELLDHPRFVAQLCALERHIARSGKDTISHPASSNAHDDLPNSAFGAIVHAALHELGDVIEVPYELTGGHGYESDSDNPFDHNELFFGQ